MGVRLDIRRLAAIDMHGGAGRSWRRRVILAEFVLAAVLCVGAGLQVALSAAGGGWRAFGAYIATIGLNYVPLALHAVSLSRRGALERELEGADILAELPYHTAAQLWILVPFALVVLALRQRQ